MVIMVIEIVLIGTTIHGISPWQFMLIPIGSASIFAAWFGMAIKGSYYQISSNKLKIYSSYLLTEEVFITQIVRIDQDSESFAKVYRATLIELDHTSLKIRLKRGNKLVVSPLDQKRFLLELKKLNPSIEIELKYKC